VTALTPPPSGDGGLTEVQKVLIRRAHLRSRRRSRALFPTGRPATRSRSDARCCGWSRSETTTPTSLRCWSWRSRLRLSLAMEKYPPEWTAEDYDEARALVVEMGQAEAEFSLDDVHQEAIRRRGSRSHGNGGNVSYRMMEERHQVARALSYLERDAVIEAIPGPFLSRWRLPSPSSPKPPSRLVYQGDATLRQESVSATVDDCAIERMATSTDWQGRLAAPKDQIPRVGSAQLVLPDGREVRIQLTAVAPSGFCEFVGEGPLPL
jgi:hypothetical protein